MKTVALETEQGHLHPLGFTSWVEECENVDHGMVWLRRDIKAHPVVSRAATQQISLLRALPTCL